MMSTRNEASDRAPASSRVVAKLMKVRRWALKWGRTPHQALACLESWPETMDAVGKDSWMRPELATLLKVPANEMKQNKSCVHTHLHAASSFLGWVVPVWSGGRSVSIGCLGRYSGRSTLGKYTGGQNLGIRW